MTLKVLEVFQVCDHLFLLNKCAIEAEENEATSALAIDAQQRRHVEQRQRLAHLPNQEGGVREYELPDRV